MTVRRFFGSEPPVNAWFRQQSGLHSRHFGLFINDLDFVVHKFKTNVDSIGTRDVQLCLTLEVKTRDARPKPNQQEVLWLQHQAITRRGLGRFKATRLGGCKVTLWDFGVHFASFPGSAPSDHGYVHWGRFTKDGAITWTKITINGLIEILRFDRRPDNFEYLDLRRHHATKETIVIEEMPLGFSIARRLVTKS